ncbi:ABC transporter ATP-binding protein [uncultured Fretibacterium sp.]|uniref:ABC transporter ATP-binding protein n=1 Tax=uncultured Fretibacterium sp. TaxID=1678694 RepID=UPI002632F1E2|nr:ABC transporter ATP-binding protein [uncultured Fretibacterium sp.]
MSGRPVLSLRNLSKTFRNGGGPLEVLSGVDLDVAEGELVCLLGKSGCGKSTLLRLVAGFLSPDSGSVEVGGGRIAGPGPDRCVVFQEDALFPWLTVRENVAFGVMRTMPRKVRDAEVRRCLEKVGLEPFGDSLPREISGGMKQRVALARVLILRPKVLLMDEPFGALDALTRGEMQGLFLSLMRDTRGTSLFVTHDVEEAVTLADRLLVMGSSPGRIRADIPVPLPRPRERSDDGFVRLCREVRGLLGAETA